MLIYIFYTLLFISFIIQILIQSKMTIILNEKFKMTTMSIIVFFVYIMMKVDNKELPLYPIGIYLLSIFGIVFSIIGIVGHY